MLYTHARVRAPKQNKKKNNEKSDNLPVFEGCARNTKSTI